MASSYIPSTAKSIAIGMAEATISPARSLPRSTKSTTMTSTAPSDEVVGDRADHLIAPVRCDRRPSSARHRRAATRGPVPGARCRSSCHFLAVLTHQHEAEAEDHLSLALCAVTAPRRISCPMRTSPTSRIRTGAPSLGGEDDAADLVESGDATHAVDQQGLARSILTWPPPTLWLFCSRAVKTSLNRQIVLDQRFGLTMTWYCRSRPPHELISATPATLRSSGLTTQSCRVRSSSRVAIRTGRAAACSGRPRRARWISVPASGVRSRRAARRLPPVP